MEASIFIDIQIFSLKISWSTASTIGGVPVGTGAVGLVGAGTFKVSIAVRIYDPVIVYFTPTCRAISSDVRVYTAFRGGDIEDETLEVL